MINATATLEHPGALKICVIAVAPTEATLPIYQAIAEAMKNPGNGKITASFKDGAMTVDIELHTEEHVDHLADIAAGAENIARAIADEGDAIAEAVGAGAEAVKAEVCDLASAAKNEANKLVGHDGPGPNDDHNAVSETSQPPTPPLDPSQEPPPATPAAEPPPAA